MRVSSRLPGRRRLVCASVAATVLGAAAADRAALPVAAATNPANTVPVTVDG